MHNSAVPKEDKVGVRTPGAEVMGGCELPNVVARSQDIRCKDSTNLTAEPSLKL